MKLGFKVCVLELLLAIPAIGFAQSISSVSSIRSETDVVHFLETMHCEKPASVKFEKYNGIPGRITDSLRARDWATLDVNHDGQKDLVLLRLNGVAYFQVILGKKEGYKCNYPLYNTAYNIVYPVIAKKNGEYLFLMYNQIQTGYNSEIDTFEYTKLRCDTLIYAFETFVNYSPSHQKYNIEKIIIDNDGECEGDCPKLKFTLDIRRGSGTAYRLLKNVEYKGRLTNEQMQKIVNLLQYSNFPRLGNMYRSELPDQPTTTITITYDGGKKKVIRVYGSKINFTLAAINRVCGQTNYVRIK